jgi:hypothetical protein
MIARHVQARPVIETGQVAYEECMPPVSSVLRYKVWYYALRFLLIKENILPLPVLCQLISIFLKEKRFTWPIDFHYFYEGKSIALAN